MLGRVRVGFDYDKLIKNKDNFNEIDNKFNDFYGLIEYLINNKYFIACDGEIMYADEMRFDYSNKEVYLPYNKSEYMNIKSKDNGYFDRCGGTKKYRGHRIGFNNIIEKYNIIKGNKYTVDYIYLIRQIGDTVIGEKVRIDSLPLRDNTITNKEAKDIFMRYIAYCYGIRNEKDTDKFYSVKKSVLTMTEKRILKELKLEYYGYYSNLDYSDVRMYELDSLLSCFTGDELKLDMEFNARRFEFECELYTRCMTRDLWVGWTRGSSEMILNNSQYFNKYKYNEFSLIFKSRWLL